MKITFAISGANERDRSLLRRGTADHLNVGGKGLVQTLNSSSRQDAVASLSPSFSLLRFLYALSFFCLLSIGFLCLSLSLFSSILFFFLSLSFFFSSSLFSFSLSVFLCLPLSLLISFLLFSFHSFSVFYFSLPLFSFSLCLSLPPSFF